MEVATTRYAIVPLWVQSISVKALVAYVALARYANGATGQCHPKLATLATDAGCCANSIRAGIDDLVDAGAVVVTERYSDRDGSRLSNVYQLRIDPPSTTCAPPLHHMEAPPPPHASQGLDEVGLETVPNGTVESPRSDIDEVTAALAAHVRTVTSREPTVTKAWRREVRLMLDGPGRADPEWSVEQLRYVIAWLDGPTRDAQFWSPNVLCPAKLRAQMPKLVGAIRRERVPNPGATGVSERIASIGSGSWQPSPLIAAATARRPRRAAS